jgi:hypothetical protein
MKSVEAIHSRRCLLLIDWMPAATVELRESEFLLWRDRAERRREQGASGLFMLSLTR